MYASKSISVKSMIRFVAFMTMLTLGILIVVAFIRKEGFTSSSPSEVKSAIETGNVLVWFYFPGCGHCEAMNSEWDKLVAMKHDYATLAIDGSKTDAVTEELKKQANVTAYPSIVFFKKGGSRSDYTQTDRTAASMDAFASALSKS
jgi:thiol-disulfide isomerase/thioredoxin